ncbi:hypothetical protein [Methylobacterium durans]|uniref:Uncharacterized protein n=1 Tax=Methylobacterium durans TaxID=2202825 RepID=A0A2U8W0M8_9HYPH|nr:hypothetical protein [Methylobacterium durans]AWN39619.1 hypothetical protein DK389_02575 [Methylobacterium durans]
MADHTQEALATMLETAWAQTQAIREKTGIVVELRFTTIGLTIVSNDFLCGRMATVSWSDLKHADTLPTLLSQALALVADQPRRQFTPISVQERSAAPAPREPARGQEGLRGRRGQSSRPHTKSGRAERKRSQA